jgi:hypothetical protein
LEAAGCDYYAKSNLFGSLSREGFMNLPMKAPIPDERTDLPSVFKYLKQGATAPQRHRKTPAERSAAAVVQKMTPAGN